MQQTQDFSRKLSIVLREGLQSWQLTNTVGHISAYLGNKMLENFDTGKYFVSKDGKNFPRNSQYGIVALKADVWDLKSLLLKLQESSYVWIAYVQEMIDEGDDSILEQRLLEKNSTEMDILGIGIFATKEELKVLTGKLSLWK